MFDGKVFKLVGVLASTAARYFNRNVKKHVPEKEGVDADFDCRVWNVPSPMEAANVFVWREMDATRNSVSMAAQAHGYKDRFAMHVYTRPVPGSAPLFFDESMAPTGTRLMSAP